MHGRGMKVLGVDNVHGRNGIQCAILLPGLFSRIVIAQRETRWKFEKKRQRRCLLDSLKGLVNVQDADTYVFSTCAAPQLPQLLLPPPPRAMPLQTLQATLPLASPTLVTQRSRATGTRCVSERFSSERTAWLTPLLRFSGHRQL